MFGSEFKKRQKGTGFTNIGKILGANVGAGQQMAGKIAQGVQAAGQKAQQQLGEARQQFKTGFQQSTTPTIGSLEEGKGLIKGSGESEEAYSKRIEQGGIDYSDIGKKVAEAKYGGPMALQDTRGLLSGAVGASQLGGLSASGMGQQQLAKQFVAGKTGYTKGQGALDQLLLTESPEAQRQLKSARESVSDLAEKTLSAATSAERQALGMRAGIEKEKSKVLGGIQSSIGELEQRASEKGQQYSRDAARLVSLLRDRSLLGKSSTDDGTKFTEEQAAYDKKLLSDLGRFGIGAGEKIDTSDPTSMIKTLQEIANRGTTGIAKQYGDPQRAALQRLSQFQQDEAKAAKFAAEKDKKAFALGDEDLQTLTPIQEQKAKRQQEVKDIEVAKKQLGISGIEDKKIPAKFTDPKRADRLSKFAKEYEEMFNNIQKIPGNNADAEDSAFVSLGKKYGFSQQEIDQFATAFPTKGQVKDALLNEAAATTVLSKSTKSQKARAANEMALQDYINKTYGIS